MSTDAPVLHGEQRFRLLPTTRFVLPVAVLLGALVAALGTVTWMRVSSAAFAVVLVLLERATARRRPVLVLSADGYRVEAGGKTRFFVPWSSVQRVLCDASEQALYAECGDRAKNLLLPPVSGFAFTFEDRAALYQAVRRAVPDRIQEVARLDAAALPAAPPGDAEPPKPPG